MALQSKSDIKDILEESYNRLDYDQIARQIQYGFGGRDEIGTTGIQSTGNEIYPLDYMDVGIDLQVVGNTNRIPGVATINLARWVDAQPEPDVTGAGEEMGFILSEFLKARSKKWSEIRKKIFLDGDQLGLGVSMLYFRTNPMTGKQYIDCEYVSPLRFFWDRSVGDVQNSQWCAKLITLPLREAEARFDRKFDDKDVQSIVTAPGAKPRKMVRIIEYYTRAGYNHEPTRALILNKFDNDPFLVEPWPLDCLPIATMTGFMLPGWRSYIGRVFLQMPIQELINQLRYRIGQDVSRSSHFTIVDEAAFTDATEDIRRLKSGEPGLILSGNFSKDQRPVERIPAVPLDQNLMTLLQMAEQDSNTLSGVNDLMKGNVTSSRTLGQDQLLQSLSNTTQSYSGKALMEYDQQVYTLALEMAKIGDVDPVNVRGRMGMQITLNDEEQPPSFISEMIPESFEVVLSKKDYTEEDEMQERAARRAELAALYQLVAPTGTLNNAWFVAEFAKACGVDPEAAVVQQQGMGVEAASMGQLEQQPMPEQAPSGQPSANGMPPAASA